MAKLAVLDSTIQKTHEWLRDIKDELGLDDEQPAYVALRATLHALRDCLDAHGAAHFGAQLPMLIRGLYYEGWNPPSDRPRLGDRRNFLDAVRREIMDYLELPDTARVVGAVLGVIDRHVSAGEIGKVMSALPANMRELQSKQPPVAGQ